MIETSLGLMDPAFLSRSESIEDGPEAHISRVEYRFRGTVVRSDVHVTLKDPPVAGAETGAF